MADVPLPDTAGSPLIERQSDYTANILMVLSFLCSGDGGMEAGSLCGLPGLPRSTSMCGRSFKNIEDAISPLLLEIGNNVVHQNLVAEVRATLGDKKDDDGNLLFDLWMNKQLPEALWPVFLHQQTWDGRVGLVDANTTVCQGTQRMLVKKQGRSLHGLC